MSASMGSPVALAGSAAVDCRFPGARVALGEGSVTVWHRDGKWVLRALEPVQPGGKITVEERLAELLAAADTESLGGGNVNSLLALQRIVPDQPICLLDTSGEEKTLREGLGGKRTDVTCLDLHALPVNAVLGGEFGDKVILKRRFPSGGELNEAQAERLDRVTGYCQAILVNSVKVLPVMERLVAAAREGCRLTAVLTRSMPAEFLRQEVLPKAHTLIAGWDEIAHVTGFPVPAVSQVPRALAWLRARAPQAAIFITLGRHGVLAAANPHAYHVCLRARPARAVQRCVAVDPAVVCGCGDAFAAGVFAELELGRSLLRGRPHGYPPVVRAALSGCAAALAWIGYPGGSGALGEGDFRIAPLLGEDEDGVLPLLRGPARRRWPTVLRPGRTAALSAPLPRRVPAPHR